MKKYLFLSTVIILFLFSCKKSGDGTSNTLMIGEVISNGYLETEYQYSLDKKLIRNNQYGVVASQPKLSLYVLYEYGPDDQISKRKIFSSNDTLNNWYVLSHDNAGRLTRMDWYLLGATVYEYRIYEYDQQNRMIKYTVKNGANNATKSYMEYTYDDQGRLDLQKNYTWYTDRFKLTQEIDYVPAGKNVYKHWQQFMTYAGDLQVTELTSESVHTLSYDEDGKVTADFTETATGRQYNNDGYLVKQTLTRVYVKPANPGNVKNLEYTYVQ
jgi:hypothetical protein